MSEDEDSGRLLVVLIVASVLVAVAGLVIWVSG